MSTGAERLSPWMVAVVVVATACQAPPPASHDLSEADVAAVRALWENLDDDGTDWEAIANRMTNDFVHLDPRAEPLFGIEAWREWVEGMELGGDDCCYELEEISRNSNERHHAVPQDAGRIVATEPQRLESDAVVYAKKKPMSDRTRSASLSPTLS